MWTLPYHTALDLEPGVPVSFIPLPSYTERVQVSVGKDNVFYCLPEERKFALQICFGMKMILETMRADTEEHHCLHCTGHEIYEISFYLLSVTVF